MMDSESKVFVGNLFVIYCAFQESSDAELSYGINKLMSIWSNYYNGHEN